MNNFNHLSLSFTEAFELDISLGTEHIIYIKYINIFNHICFNFSDAYVLYIDM